MALLALVGCQPEQPTVIPTVTEPVTSVSVVARPTASQTPSATSSEDALYAEAEAVYRAYWKADLEVLVSGGSSRLPDTIKPYVMGEYALAKENQYSDYKANGLEVKQANRAKVRFVKPASNANGSLVALDACWDSSGLQWRQRGGEWKAGGVTEATFFFKRDTDGRLKIFLIDSVDGGCK